MKQFFKRYPVSAWPLVMAVVVLLLTLMGVDVRNLLRLDVSFVGGDQWWRVFTSHWVHIGWEHTWLNVGGFILLSWLNPRGAWFYWLAFYVFSSVLISVFLLTNSHISTYVGASGVLHGLLILGAYLSCWLDPLRKVMMVTVIVCKLVWEQSPFYQGYGIESVIGAHVAVDAHLMGGLCGLLVLAYLVVRNKVIPQRLGL